MKFVITFLLAGFVSVSAFAQQRPAHLSGFGSGRLAAEYEAEDKLLSEIVPDSLRSIVTALSREIHVAGTPAQARTRDIVIDRMKGAGVDTKVYPYEVYLPHALSSSLEMIAPQHKRYKLEELMVPGENPTAGYPWVNGYSTAGDVSGGVVYVNYGLHEDYHDLDSLGISVRGKIVLARYGRSYRGIKAKLAEEHRAAALIIYTDPSGDGYDAGDVYPNGPMRPADGVQRGSIYNGHGDPTTPNIASTPGAEHLAFDAAVGVPKIPVIPISYGIAQEFLKIIGGRDIPSQSWQGGFPFRYHIGVGDVKARLTVQLEKPQLSPIYNTVSEIKGSVWPDEWIIVGSHRDAWCYGAEDNVSGCASVIAAAEGFGKLAASGWRPKRSIRFITWDAEEWGLIGSTEFAEQFESELTKHAVIYINQDMCATGSTFDASGDPTLYPLIYEAAQSLRTPNSGSLYDVWAKRFHSYSNAPARPEIGFLGGGSDFSPFYNHLGIPSAEHGFSGPFGQYHSNHDNLNWTLHFGDSTFAYHTLSSKLLALEAVRMADADILPFDFVELGKYLHNAGYAVKIRAIREYRDPLSFPMLDSVVDTFISVAEHFARLSEEKGLSDGSRTLASNSALAAINSQVREVYRSLMMPAGLSSDAWVRNPLVSSDPDNGYADLKLPGIELAMRKHEASGVQREVENLVRRVTAATDLLRTQMGMLR